MIDEKKLIELRSEKFWNLFIERLHELTQCELRIENMYPMDASKRIDEYLGYSMMMDTLSASLKVVRAV